MFQKSSVDRRTEEEALILSQLAMVLFIDNFKFSLILFFLQIRISLFFSLISTLFIGCVYSPLCRLLVVGAHWLGPWRHLGKKEIKSISWAGPFLKSRILFKRITLAGVDPRQGGVHLLPLGHRARHVRGEPPGIIRFNIKVIRINNHRRIQNQLNQDHENHESPQDCVRMAKKDRFRWSDTDCVFTKACTIHIYFCLFFNFF